jgi:dynactin 1
LEDELKQTKQSGKLYEEAVEALHSDLETLEQENEDYKKMLKKLERNGGRVGVSPIHKIPSDMNESSGQISPLETEIAVKEHIYEEGSSEVVSKAYLGNMEQRIQYLRMIVKNLKAQNIRLTQKKTMLEAVELSDKNDPLIKFFGKRTEQSDELEARKNTKALEKEVREFNTKTLEKEVREFMAEPLIVDLSTTRSKMSSPGWHSRLNEPDVQYRMRLSKLETLVKRQNYLALVV